VQFIAYNREYAVIERRELGTDSGVFPEESIPDGRPGRKPAPARQVLDAVLWTLNTGAQWYMLPQCYPN
jgi:transposase